MLTFEIGSASLGDVGKEMGVRILVARFNSGADFLRNFDSSVQYGALLVPTKAIAAIDEPLVVEVAFPELPNHVLLRAQAVDRVEERGGLLVRFGQTEQSKRDFVLACARGEMQPVWQRRHRRFPVRLEVHFGLQGAQSLVPAFTEDVSSGGIFLRTPMTLSVRTPIEMTIDFADGSPPVSAIGRVAWVRQHPPTAGFGVAWDERKSLPMKRLRKVIRDLKIRGKMREAGPEGATRLAWGLGSG